MPTRKIPRHIDTGKTSIRSVLLIATALCFPGVTFARNSGSAALEEVVVTESCQIIQDSIAIKRSETTIVDGLSAADIGDLPVLSFGEAPETITGTASHRENGGATEISIRGLGPFLKK